MFKRGRLALLSGAVLTMVACADEVTELEESGQEDVAEDQEETTDDESTDVLEDGGTDEEYTSIDVDMVNSDSTLVGSAVFSESEEGVTLTLNLEGLPAGEYGMHIHEFGIATPPTFEDAGGHFNPTDAEHGFDSEDGHHLGDLPNLVVPENGIVNETIEVSDVSLLPDAEYTLATEDGTSLIIHTGPDDYETQPTGDSGERMVGGVIFAPQD
ncbi:MAG: superoxide dismutase family protein [Alkalibacterium sp.]|nr:superoxide dismutase family protein [Alkalibacterium sp.]